MIFVCISSFNILINYVFFSDALFTSDTSSKQGTAETDHVAKLAFSTTLLTLDDAIATRCDGLLQKSSYHEVLSDQISHDSDETSFITSKYQDITIDLNSNCTQTRSSPLSNIEGKIIIVNLDVCILLLIYIVST